MRISRKLSFFFLVVAVVCIPWLTLEIYCTLVYGADASPFRGCDSGVRSEADALAHRVSQSRYHDPTRPGGHEREEKTTVRAGTILVRPRAGEKTTNTTNVIEKTMGKLSRAKSGNVILDGSESDEERTPPECSKRILFWADPRAEGLKSCLVNFAQRRVLCGDIDCTAQLTISMRWADFAVNDVVIFYHKVERDWPELMKRRPRDQLWIFYTREAPAHTSDRKNFPEGISHNVYNWTKLYLSGSDFMTIYGRFIPKDVKKSRKPMGTHNWYANKTKLCAWVASNCKYTSWDRLGFVRELQKHMPIDAYGKCGSLKCARTPDDCRAMMSPYKFYLALESHTCREYITEKVWRNAFEQNVIPVVYGARKADYERALPPKSYIHVEDFASFQELAEYLLRVAGDEEEYNSYFAWRTKGVIKRETASTVFGSQSLCEITKKVRAVHDGETTGRTDDRNIKEWWQGSCFEVEKPMVYR